MLERYENAIQIATLAVCVTVSLFRAAKYRSRSWTLLSFFYGSWLLGDIYWLNCLLFYGETPHISVVSDLSWYAALIFLYMLLRKISPPEELRDASPVSWLGPAFTIGMAVFFMIRGEIISNLIYAGLMGLLLFAAIRRLIPEDRTEQSCLPTMILIYCLLEYSLWTSSCFWNDAALFQPYYIFDLLLTMCFPFLIPAIGKAVTT